MPWSPRLTRAELGAIGEELAARFLVREGLVMLGRNIRAPEAELDLVALDGDVLVVVEVKAGWWPADAPGDWIRPRDHVSPEAARVRRWVAKRIARDLGLSRGSAVRSAGRFEIVEVGCGRRRRNLGSGGVVIERCSTDRSDVDADLAGR